MRGPVPTLHCDAEDGLCGNWEVDYYETGASKVDGRRVTLSERAPGWTSTDLVDYCPEHMPECWMDRHKDIWVLGEDGLMHTPETRPFPREHVEKKWGPLFLVRSRA